MPKFVLLHAGLHVIDSKGKQVVLGLGETVELDQDFVDKHDPKGASYVTEETYERLAAQVAIQKKSQEVIAAKTAELQSAKDKLAAMAVTDIHLAAVEKIEALRAAKKAPKPPKEERPIDAGDEKKKASKKSTKEA